MSVALALGRAIRIESLNNLLSGWGLMRDAKFSSGDWPDYFEEPEHWRQLQERARSERDPRKLEAIIAEMNQLLTDFENKAKGNHRQRTASPRRTSPKQAPLNE